MKKKLFLALTIILTMFFAFSSDAKAQILSDQDVIMKIQQVEELFDFDFLSLVNRGELVGYRLDDFRMQSQVYANTIYVAIDNLKNISSQIQYIRASQEISNTDKEIRIRKLYQDADLALYDIDNKTANYLINLKYSMPSITYERYLKKFQEYYNGLDLTSSDLHVYR